MSAITVARLDELRSYAIARAPRDEYTDALRKAPRLIVVAHLLRSAGHTLALTARVAMGRTRR